MEERKRIEISYNEEGVVSKDVSISNINNETFIDILKATYSHPELPPLAIILQAILDNEKKFTEKDIIVIYKQQGRRLAEEKQFVGGLEDIRQLKFMFLHDSIGRGTVPDWIVRRWDYWRKEY
jgi:hypothetical protein